MADIKGFEARLAREAASMQSIESSFVQEKYMEVFDRKIRSAGTFSYMRGGKVRLQYDTPVKYLIVMNGGKLKIVADGKTNVVNVGSNALMQQMQGMITACMVGDLAKLSGDYRLEYAENASQYVVKIHPLKPEVKAYLHAIDICFDKRDMSVDRLRMAETAKNYTEYTFSHKKFNTLKDESRFAIR